MKPIRQHFFSAPSRLARLRCRLFLGDVDCG
ncbi:unnamed protein product [Clonostachys rosea f. rosea IK726]|uniref:Uncharacterized protein n=1 Tax=Clonostachys rosea f. rosea IK726 TaxID=1349383 RepID=A0ACA9UH43_BIOOC|nr:unnamed protein product [Clonostachys rosea f. rosea IK726]